MALSWTVQKETLLSAIRTLDQIPVRPGIPASLFIQVRRRPRGRIRLRLAAEARGEFTLRGRGQWPFEKSYYLDRRTFVPWVLAADETGDREFVFEQLEGGRFRVRQGARTKMFIGQPPMKGYGFVTGLNGTEKVQARVALTRASRRLLTCAFSVATNDTVTPQLNCVYVKPQGQMLAMYSTNKTLIYRARAREEVTSASAIPFPLLLIKLLESSALKEVQWRETAVYLIYKNGKIWQSVPARALTEFPSDQIDAYMRERKTAKLLFEVSAQQLLAPLDRLRRYAETLTRIDWVVKVRGRKGEASVVLSTEVPQARFRERLKVRNRLEEDFEIEWPLQMVLPVFQFLGERELSSIRVKVDKRGRSFIVAGRVSLIVPKGKP